MFQTTDSYFYWALANFFRTGQYYAPHPYYYTKPSTMEPPYYSILLFIAEIFPRPDIIIHAFHIGAVLISGLLLSKVLYKITKSRIAWSIGWLFTLLPSNIIYTANLMSEIFTLTFVSAYLYLLFRIIIEKKEDLYIYLLILSALGSLMRYNLIAFWGVFMALFVLKRKKKLKEYIFALISIFIISGWILFNHSLNGSWGLSNTGGKYLYNRIVWQDKLLPEENNKYLLELKERLGHRQDLIWEPWWVIESHIMSENFGETETSLLLQRIAIASLLLHPGEYLVKSVISYIAIHGNGVPFHDQAWFSLGMDNAVCQPLGTINTCNPILKSKYAKDIFSGIIDIGVNYYHTFPFLLNILFLFPALIITIISRNKFYKICAILYLAGTVLPVLVVHRDVRYIYSVYPIKLILFAILINSIYLFYKKKLVLKNGR